MQQSIPDHLRQHFYHLYAIALADLHVSPYELEMLISFGNERGITRHEIQGLLLSTVPFHSEVPNDPRERIRCLYDMARLALADTVLTDEEHRVLERITLLFGYDESSAALLLDRLLRLAESETDLDDVIRDVLTSS